MSYWACARVELRREAVAQHFLNLNGYETYIPRVREQRLRRALKAKRTMISLSGQEISTREERRMALVGVRTKQQ